MVRFAIFGLIILGVMLAQAQETESPSGTEKWQINMAESEFPGPRPQFNLPQRPLDSGEFLVGLPFAEDSQGNPGYVFVPSSVTQTETWQPPRRMPRAPRVDRVYDYTAKFDSEEGEFEVTVSRLESHDGRSLTLTADMRVPQGDVNRYVLVFDRR